MKVCVISVPPGEAPEWVRKQWVGLDLPLADGEEGARSAETWGALTAPKTLPATIWQFFAGKYKQVYGFVVDAPRALEILEAHAPDAAQWWRTQTVYWRPGRKFVFPAEDCRELGGSGAATSRRFCPACGIMFMPGDADLDRGEAMCAACDCVTALDRLSPPVFGPAPPPVRQGRLVIPHPRHYSVKDDDRGLRIRFCWIHRGASKAATIAFLWNSFVVGWYWSALTTAETRFGWFAAVWGVPFAAIGLLLVYATLAALLNRTVIKATPEFLTVRHGPLPWFGNRKIRVADLERLFCDRDPEEMNGGRFDIYRVAALTKDAGTVGLVTDRDAARVLFIEQELERWLKLNERGAGCKVGL